MCAVLAVGGLAVLLSIIGSGGDESAGVVRAPAPEGAGGGAGAQDAASLDGSAGGTARDAPAAAGRPPRAPRAPRGRARPGLPPQRPLPVLAEADMARARDLAVRAGALLNEAKRAQAAGDRAGLWDKAGEGYSLVLEALRIVEPLRHWEEDAVMGGWAISAEEDGRLVEVNRWVRTMAELRRHRHRG